MKGQKQGIEGIVVDPGRNVYLNLFKCIKIKVGCIQKIQKKPKKGKIWRSKPSPVLVRNL